jgi:hypothetical protein
MGMVGNKCFRILVGGYRGRGHTIADNRPSSPESERQDLPLITLMTLIESERRAETYANLG